MIKASHNDRNYIVDILRHSFDSNQSVNYILRQDSKRTARLQKLMEYSFDYCQLFGDVFITEDKKGCALVLKPDQKKNSLKSILLDAKLALNVVGVGDIKKVIAREAAINAIHPEGKLFYLWFIGVDPLQQNNGIGSKLLEEVINRAQAQNRIICLETSTLKNIPWYEKFGFTVYKELDFGYKLHCMKRE